MAANNRNAIQNPKEGRTMTDITTKGLIVVPAGEGEPHWIGASRITVKATAAQTNGGYGLIVSEVACGTSAPLHIHHTADEGIWVITGHILVRCGTDEFALGPGGYASLPRGIPHTFLAEEAWIGGDLVCVRFYLGRLISRNLFRQPDSGCLLKTLIRLFPHSPLRRAFLGQ